MLFFRDPLTVIQRINKVKEVTCASTLFSKVREFGFIQGDDLFRIHLPQMG